MWKYNYNYTMEDELYHYGILGMKWGVHRSNSRMARNDRLARKAAKFDLKAASTKRAAENRHQKYDIEGKVKAIKKANKFNVKAAKYEKKALKTSNESKKLRLEQKAKKFAFKSSKQAQEGETISRATGYGMNSMSKLKKSLKYQRKADKARYKIAKNKYYRDKMQRKVSQISKEDRNNAYAFVKNLR